MSIDIDFAIEIVDSIVGMDLATILALFCVSASAASATLPAASARCILLIIISHFLSIVFVGYFFSRLVKL